MLRRIYSVALLPAKIGVGIRTGRGTRDDINQVITNQPASQHVLDGKQTILKGKRIQTSYLRPGKPVTDVATPTANSRHGQSNSGGQTKPPLT